MLMVNMCKILQISPLRKILLTSKLNKMSIINRIKANMSFVNMNLKEVNVELKGNFGPMGLTYFHKKK